MGAHFLDMIIKTQSEEKCLKKFWEIYDSDRTYYGTNPYSGSWATMDGILIVKDPYPEKRWTKKKYRDIIEWLEDNTDKWCNAKAIKSTKGFIVGGWAAS